MSVSPSVDHRRRRMVYVSGATAVVATMVAGLAPHLLAVIAGLIAIVAAIATFVFIVVGEVDD
ncbi:MAG TPA: hypothetical protein VHW26_01760 [Solirubrobacteraceae bacterium]|nr:hypothetical protein [Solirubrobacteraceae bacterium]